MLAGVLDELRTANQRYAASFDGQGMTAPPTRHLAVLTCMDSRIDPAAILGLTTGEANVVRNAGGRATSDAVRSLALSAGLLGLERVVVMHHTDCALAGVTEESIHARLKAAGLADAESWQFLAMPDPDTALRDDVETLRRSPLFIRSLQVVGWRYDVASGRVTEVVSPADG
jgi:carbonic anhydrase